MRKPIQTGGIAVATLAIGGSLILAGTARADNLTISTAQTTPVATATAANNTPGNITLASTGSVAVTTATAATINSNNTLTNNGTLSSSIANNAVTLLIDGSQTPAATLVNNGSVSASTDTGSGNIALLLSGGPVTGSITSGLSSAFTANGTNAIAVSLAAPFTGDVQLRSMSATGTGSRALSVTSPLTGNLWVVGTVTQSGTGGYGVLINAPVSGTVSTAAALSVGTTRVVDTSGTVTPGLMSTAGVRISANVGGGFANDKYYIDSTGVIVPPALVDTSKHTLLTGSISSTGSAPALWIAPDNANPQAISLGTVGTGTDAYAVINRGAITTTLGNRSIATTAVLIGGGGATTTLAGGFVSQSGSTITSTSFDAATTAVDFAAGAVVPAMSNFGTITASATQTAAVGSVVASAGGSAYGVVVEAGASLPVLTNSGTISAGAVGTNNGATAVLDKSGSIATLINTGTIAATATGTGGVATAIDLSAGTAPVTVANSGTVTGAIRFGSGYSTLQLTGGTITGAIGYGSGGGLLALSGAAALANVVTGSGTVDISLANSARLDMTKVSAKIGSIAATGTSVIVAPVVSGVPALSATGTASFTGSSSIVLSLQSLAFDQNVTVVSAAGGVSTDHLGTLIDASSAPYLFTASAPVMTATTIDMTLIRKTAAEIGLINGQAALYDQSVVALANSPTESAAIANLPNQASVVAAYRQITPPSFGRAQLRTAQTIADAGFGATADRMTVIDNMRHGGTQGLGVWGQEFGNLDSQDAGVNELGYNSAAFGFAGGVDTPLLGVDVGLALITSWANVNQTSAPGLADVPMNVSTLGVAPYLYWSHKALFVELAGLAAHTTYNSTRTLSIGSVADTVSASWSGTQYAASALVGARFDFGRVRIVPSDAITWTQLHQGSYTEAGGGAFNLAVDSQSDRVTTNTARLSVALFHPLENGNLRFEAHGAYAYQFSMAPTNTVARYVSGGDAMNLPGDSVAAGQTGFGGSLGYVQGSAIVTVGYDRRQDSGYHNQALVVSGGVTF